MEKEILELFATQGVFVIMFCYLLFYVLKENSKREANYQKMVLELTESMPEMKKDLEEIKNKVC